MSRQSGNEAAKRFFDLPRIHSDGSDTFPLPPKEPRGECPERLDIFLGGRVRLINQSVGNSLSSRLSRALRGRWRNPVLQNIFHPQTLAYGSCPVSLWSAHCGRHKQMRMLTKIYKTPSPLHSAAHWGTSFRNLS